MDNSIICNLCDTKLTYKRDLSKHQITVRCKSIYKIIYQFKVY
uniref:C2H2-type domain-containing protein n=1 Tax=viral metagenome TaxID=1070528 RepID=A0A6C0I4U8_9ZZZZ